MKHPEDTILYMVIPCYNEEQVLPVASAMFLDKLRELVELKKISVSSRIMFVNDGSSDSTWSIIKKLAEEDPHFSGISLSRNRGHQNALLAGLMEARDKCDITISIDCDGQDDINAMNEMIDKYYEGNEIVYAARDNRDTDSFFKRFSAESYYKILKMFGGSDVIYNHADYRLISSKVLDKLADYHEVNLFLRGMIPLIGYPSDVVYYSRNRRLAGKSHYPLSKMLSLAFDGITSLSVKPIHYITGFGIITAIASFIGIIWSIVRYFTGHTTAGWASTLCVICFIGGIQLIALGIIGEYVGKIYLEVKHRPRFIISERTHELNEDIPAV